MSAVQLKGTEFDTMESSVRLTHAQVAALFTLCSHPVVEVMAEQETKDRLAGIAERLIDALSSDIEGYIE